MVQLLEDADLDRHLGRGDLTGPGRSSVWRTVRFAMEAETPSAPVAGAKLTWQLSVSDTVSAGGGLEVR